MTRRMGSVCPVALPRSERSGAYRSAGGGAGRTTALAFAAARVRRAEGRLCACALTDRISRMTTKNLSLIERPPEGCVRNLLIATGKNGRAGARLRFTIRFAREKFAGTTLPGRRGG